VDPYTVTIGLGPTFYGENGSTLGMVPFIIYTLHHVGIHWLPIPFHFGLQQGVFVSQLETLHPKGFSHHFPYEKHWQLPSTHPNLGTRHSAGEYGEVRRSYPQVSISTSEGICHSKKKQVFDSHGELFFSE